MRSLARIAIMAALITVAISARSQTCVPSPSQTCTANIGLAMPNFQSEGWDVPINNNALLLDNFLSGTTPVSGFKTASLNGVLWVDGVKYTTCAGAVAAIGNSVGMVVIPSSYTGAACPSVPANVTIWDLTGGSPSALNTCAWNSTSGSGLHAMLRCTQTRNSPASSDLSGYFVNVVTGTLPSNQALDGISGELDFTGTINNSPTGLVVHGNENAVSVSSNGGTIPLIQSVVGYLNTGVASTTNVGEVDGVTGLGCNAILGTGTVGKCYGVVGSNQINGTAENYSMVGLGDWKGLNGHQFDVTDNGGVPRHIVQWRTDNTIQYFPLVDGSTGWRWSRQDAGADYLKINATDGVFVPNVNLKLGQLISSYNNIATVGNGVSPEYATADLTAQSAAVSTTTLYAIPPTGAGQYRVVWNSKVTTAATTSSTLGALTITYTDPDGTVQTITAPATISAGTIATTSTGNTTTTVLIGMPLSLNCKASTNIQYAFAYASSGATAMQYNLHLKLEAM